MTLKRSSFKRPAYEPAPSAPLKPLERPVHYYGHSERVPAVMPKSPVLRAPHYLRYVASHACSSCRIEGYSQAAHSNQAIHGKGGARKASDVYTFPLCASRPGHQGCHYLHDNCIDMTKHERDALEDTYIARMMAMATADGWRFLSDEITRRRP
jgi:hypothetical protein